MNKNEYHILFTIPVRDPLSLASIFKIHPLPLFHENKTYISNPAYPYIGVFHNREIESFVPLTESDFQVCTEKMHCDTLTPVFDKDHQICSVSNYFHKPRDCSYRIFEGHKPSFLNVKEKTWVATKDLINCISFFLSNIVSNPCNLKLFCFVT